MNYAARKVGGVGWVVCDTTKIIATGSDEQRVLDQVSEHLGTKLPSLQQSPIEIFEATLRLAIASTLTADREAFDAITTQLAAGNRDTLQLKDLVLELASQVESLSARNATLERSSQASKRRAELRKAFIDGGITRDWEVEMIVNKRLQREGLA